MINELFRKEMISKKSKLNTMKDVFSRYGRKTTATTKIVKYANKS